MIKAVSLLLAAGIWVAAPLSKAPLHRSPDLSASAVRKSGLIIAQQYDGADPHGEDPHGPDPHDEQHDPGLQANAKEKERKATKNVYGDDIPNTQKPQPPW